MSYNVETDIATGHKYIVDVKRRRSICSTDGYLSRAQRNTLCAKHLQACGETIANEEVVKKRAAQHSLRTKKRAVRRNKPQIRRWAILPRTDLTKDKSNARVDHMKDVLSQCQHRLEQNLINDSSTLKTELIANEQSESSIEYDYANPLPTLVANDSGHRRVCIATIHLQEEQWHQLELFIKHFSSYASLSHNMNVNSSTTHLLVDDSTTPLRCVFSKKIFQAVARHAFVVSTRWIEECLSRNAIVDEAPFEIHGDSTISTMHLARRYSTTPLFAPSVAFAIDCASFQRTLTRNELAELAVVSGATLFDSEEQTTKTGPPKLLLVLADPAADRRRLESRYQSWHQHVRFLTPGYLLKSIIYHKQQCFEDFEL